MTKLGPYLLFIFVKYGGPMASWQPLTDSFMVSRSHFGKLTGVLNARMPDWHHGSHFMILATTFMVSRSHFGQMAGILDARMPDCLKVCYIP